MISSVFALGNFDGVHRGHRAVIDAAIERARVLNIAARVLTFEPHPRSFFQPQQPPFRLTPQPLKERLLKACGIDEVITMPFTAEFAGQSARHFAEDVLARELRASHVVAGHDFVFGHQRTGDMAKLAAWLAPHNVGVTEVAALGDRGEVFSSTRVRELLLQGEASAAAEILGRSWSLTGIIEKGAQRGRTIGVPTANINLGEALRPRFGVYAIDARKTGDTLWYRGVANIGVRPTVGGKTENLEAYLFDFNRDIYGEEWEFALRRFIRPEQKFDSFDLLKAQISRDIEVAKEPS